MFRTFLMKYRGILTFFMTALILMPPLVTEAETIELQYKDGTYLVRVQINRAIVLDFLLDTGSSDVTIPVDVFSTLVRTGTVLQSDFLGTANYKLANGSVVQSQRFRLHEVKVGNHLLTDVVANVTPLESSYPLLGQSFLSKLGGWSVDNYRHALILADDSGKVTSNATGATRAGPAQANSCMVSTYTNDGILACDVFNFTKDVAGRPTLACTRGRGAAEQYKFPAIWITFPTSTGPINCNISVSKPDIYGRPAFPCTNQSGATDWHAVPCR